VAFELAGGQRWFGELTLAETEWHVQNRIFTNEFALQLHVGWLNDEAAGWSLVTLVGVSISVCAVASSVGERSAC